MTALEYRHLFPGHFSYFKTGTIGLQPTRTPPLSDSQWGSQRWYEHWAREIAQVRRLFAQLIGAQPHEILLAPSISVALSCIAAALQTNSRSQLLMSDLDVPALGTHWAREKTVHFLSSDRMHFPIEQCSQALTENTLLVLASRVQPASAAITDISTLAHLAHQQGSLLLIDDSYGAGYLSLNVQETGIDLLVADSRRWLMGGPGLTFLYVREKAIPRLTPLFSGAHGVYQAVRDPLDLLRVNSMAPSLQILADVRVGLELIRTIGIQQIGKHIQEQRELLLDEFHDQKWDIPSDPQGALILLRMEQVDRVMAELEAEHFLIGHQPGLLEIALSLSTTREDCSRLIDYLRRMFSNRC